MCGIALSSILFSSLSLFATGCSTSETLVVDFRDLTTDFYALEESLRRNDWGAPGRRSLSKSPLLPIPPVYHITGKFESSGGRTSA